MSNKYSGLSDFEINKLIAKSIYRYSSRHFVGDMEHGDDVEIFIIDSGKVQHYAFFNICEDDAISFALMIDNEMKLEKIEQWRASSWVNDNIIVSSSHENPCRSIAETFLLMKDAEKKDEK